MTIFVCLESIQQRQSSIYFWLGWAAAVAGIMRLAKCTTANRDGQTLRTRAGHALPPTAPGHFLAGPLPGWPPVRVTESGYRLGYRRDSEARADAGLILQLH